MAKRKTIHCLLSVDASKGWELHQMDVHNVFLHGDLGEDIYMTPPTRFWAPRPNLVCKLKKSLYGLRQAPRQWFFKLTSALYDYGFRQCPLDYSLLVYRHCNIFLPILICINDVVLTRNIPNFTIHSKST